MRPYPRADLLVAAAAAVVFVLTVFTMPDDPCTAVDPCRAAPLTAFAVSLLAGVVSASLVHRWTAVCVAAVCVAAWPIADRVDGADLSWRVSLPWLLLVTTMVVAGLRSAARPDSAPLRPIPAAPRIAVLTRTVAAGGLLLTAGTAAIGGTVWRQQQVTAQEKNAGALTAVVREHLDDGAAIRVDLPDGRQWTMEVLDAGGYPTGSRVEILSDDAGLRQLRSEPYDITLLFLPLAVMVATGCALLVRDSARRRMMRRFFAEPQPVRRVRAQDCGDEVFVLVPGADRTARQFMVKVAARPVSMPVDEADEDLGPPTVPATLYGTPGAGNWCTVQIDDHVYVPQEPLADVEVVAYDDTRGMPADIDDDWEPSVDDAELLEQDRDPAGPREHVPAGRRAWLRAMLLGWGTAAFGVLMVASHADAPSKAMGVAGAVGAAVGFEWGWRTHLRPRVRWGLGGVAVVTSWSLYRTSWTPCSGVDVNEYGDLLVTDGDAEFAVPVRSGSSRTVWQIVAALRHARRLALDTAAPSEPPEMSAPRRPWLWHLAWTLTVATTLTVFWTA